MRSLLIRCYPADWRARYGDEFQSLLEERPLGPYDVADILLGALDARLRSRGHSSARQEGKGLTMSLRIGGLAAILGAALLGVAGLLGSDVIIRVDGEITQAVFLAGLAVLLVGLTGLSAFQGRAYPALSWTAFGLAAVGMAAIITAFLVRPWITDDLWYVFMFGVLAAIGGCLLFAIATYRTAVLSRAAALLIGIGSVVVLFQPIIAVGIASIAIGWFVLGIEAIRHDRSTTDPRPA